MFSSGLVNVFTRDIDASLAFDQGYQGPKGDAPGGQGRALELFARACKLKDGFGCVGTEPRRCFPCITPASAGSRRVPPPDYG